MKKPIIIIGNGVAGVICAKTLRDFGIDEKLIIFTEEKYHYYPRPNLIEFLAGNLGRERLGSFPPEWYEKQEIEVHLNEPVEEIDPRAKEIITRSGQKLAYSYLVLATGARAFMPPFPGAEKKGVFVLRTFDDALSLVDWVEKNKKVIVIGGGLLGLETARALQERGAEVEVLEFSNHLLPRQLDERGASLLKQLIELQGIRVFTGQATEMILGADAVEGVSLKGGKTMPTQTVVVAAGVRSNVNLAQKAGVNVERGVIIDEYGQTSVPSILAAGDVAQFRGRIYGIIPAAFDQARIVATTLSGKKIPYQGTIPSNTLKVMGIELTSIGVVNPEDEEVEVLSSWQPERGMYRKIVLKEGIPIGIIWLGTRKGVTEIDRAIKNKKDISAWKENIFSDDFDFSVLK